MQLLFVLLDKAGKLFPGRPQEEPSSTCPSVNNFQQTLASLLQPKQAAASATVASHRPEGDADQPANPGHSYMRIMAQALSECEQLLVNASDQQVPFSKLKILQVVISGKLGS